MIIRSIALAGVALLATETAHAMLSSHLLRESESIVSRALKARHPIGTMQRGLCDGPRGRHYSTSIPAKTTVNDLVDMLWSSVNGTPNSSTPRDVNKAATTMYMCYPGIPINPSTLDGMLDPSNPRGSIASLEYFSAMMVNSISDIEKYAYAPTTSTVTGAYGSVLRAANATAGDFNRDELERYEEARSILFTKKPSLFRGKPPVEDDSEAYVQFKEKRQQYQNAVIAFNAMKLSLDLSNPVDQRTWMLYGTQLQSNIDNAWAEWNAAYKTDIESALAILGSTLRNGIGKEIARADQLFTSAPIPSVLPGGAPWYPVYTFPSRWWSMDAPGWTTLTVSAKKSYDHLERHSRSFSAGGGFSAGLFSYGGSYGSTTDYGEEQHSTSNLDMSMEVALVELHRPWMVTDWMKSDTWYMQGKRAGAISSGSVKGNTNHMVIPTVPNRLIVARNVVLKADWGQTTSDYFTRHVQTKQSFGWGPFKVNGQYEQNDHSENHGYNFDGSRLEIKGMQIIGFGASTPPYSAPITDPNLRR